jgi:hypothetical protein
MSNSLAPPTTESFVNAGCVPSEPDRVGRLLAGLQAAAPRADDPTGSATNELAEQRFENQLAVVRLGVATSLFFALRTKHAPTAAHCLRVALSCSAWSQRMGLEDSLRDRIEVAALLHDLGKIGIPDRILRKPGKLSVEEQLVMERCPKLGCEILRGCTGDQELLNIVLHCNAWYQSRRQDDAPRGKVIPLGARMLAIADAFDAMTTDSVYRRAMSRERAIQELIDGSCTQFDPELAIDFNRMLEERPEMYQRVTVDRWLQRLHVDDVQRLWGTIADRVHRCGRNDHAMESGNALPDRSFRRSGLGTHLEQRLCRFAQSTDQGNRRTLFGASLLAIRVDCRASDADPADRSVCDASACPSLSRVWVQARYPWHGDCDSRPFGSDQHGRAAQITAPTNDKRSVDRCRESHAFRRQY